MGALIVAALAGAAGTAHAAFPGANGYLAVVDVDAGQIALVNPDGTSYRRVATPGLSQILEVDVSPDGTRLAFDANGPDGNHDIYAVDADGTDLQRLTDAPGSDAHPVWTPDGLRIVFDSTRNGASTDLIVMNADGSDEHTLYGGPFLDFNPAVSPDGTRVAFSSSASGVGVHTVAMDGGDLRVLTQPGGSVFDNDPDWAPDGSLLVFARSGGMTFGLRTVAPADLTETSLRQDGHSPAYSPDGTRVAFDYLHPSRLFLMPADGSGNAAPVRTGVRTPSWGSGALPTVNLDPVARISGPDTVYRRETYTWSAAGSHDPDGTVAAYRWDFTGDGLPELVTTAPEASWRYDATGYRHATVTVEDAQGARSSASMQVRVIGSIARVNSTVAGEEDSVRFVDCGPGETIDCPA